MSAPTPPPAPRLAATALAVLCAGALAALAYTHPLPGISEEARRLTAILAVVGTLWIAETVPLAVTALLGPALAVVCGVATADRAFAAFGNPIIMLFVGSFLLAKATFKHRLNERIAYRVLSLGVLRNDPTRAFIFLGLTTAVLSAWMSNTATTAMMLPIAQSVLLAMVPAGAKEGPRTYAAALMLIVAYSASIGGLFTPIGTPPNLIGIGLIEQATGTRISFLAWVRQVFPITVVILLLMMGYFAYLFRAERAALTYDRSQMVRRYATLGRWRPVELRIAAALLITMALWILPPLLRLLHAPTGRVIAERLPEAVVPVLVAASLFLFRADRTPGSAPILTVTDLAEIDWPVIVLFAGGMCLGGLMIHTGLATGLGEGLAGYLPPGGSAALVLLFCGLAIAASEVTSNTASANMVIPVVVAVSAHVGGDAVALGLAATVACTFGFMLPVSTPTNAMAYATGLVTQRQMIRYGVVLDLLAAVLLSVWFGLVLLAPRAGGEHRAAPPTGSLVSIEYYVSIMHNTLSMSPRILPRMPVGPAGAILPPGEIFCPVGRALDVLGDRWTLVLVSHLLDGPRGFQELRARTGITPRVLSSRLRRLAAGGFVERAAEGPRPLYRATARGRALEPVITAIARWYLRHGLPALSADPHRFSATSARSILESLPYMLREDRAGNVDLTFEIRLTGTGGGVWTVRISGGACTVRPGFAERADVRYTAEAPVWCAVALGLRDARDVYREGLMTKDGGREALDYYFHRIPVAGNAKPAGAQVPRASRRARASAATRTQERRDG